VLCCAAVTLRVLRVPTVWRSGWWRVGWTPTPGTGTTGHHWRCVSAAAADTGVACSSLFSTAGRGSALQCVLASGAAGCGSGNAVCVCLLGSRCSLGQQEVPCQHRQQPPAWCFEGHAAADQLSCIAADTWWCLVVGGAAAAAATSCHLAVGLVCHLLPPPAPPCRRLCAWTTLR
jgi:hypothetical protein